MNGLPSDHDLLIDIKSRLFSLEQKIDTQFEALAARTDKAHGRIDKLYIISLATISGVIGILIPMAMSALK